MVLSARVSGNEPSRRLGSASGGQGRAGTIAEHHEVKKEWTTLMSSKIPEIPGESVLIGQLDRVYPT